MSSIGGNYYTSSNYQGSRFRGDNFRYNKVKNYSNSDRGYISEFNLILLLFIVLIIILIIVNWNAVRKFFKF